ncbi:MAG: hypothetical protein UT81_C0003G0032 [Parcubacteria group bacterium GW2011_GWA2_40_14]|nr:MAG: hypothetical protein UT81_C0003G0032 [Parcubacteria group bacterium GW2011_GWA2_40_14]
MLQKVKYPGREFLQKNLLKKEYFFKLFILHVVDHISSMTEKDVQI